MIHIYSAAGSKLNPNVRRNVSVLFHNFPKTKNKFTYTLPALLIQIQMYPGGRFCSYHEFVTSANRRFFFEFSTFDFFTRS